MKKMRDLATNPRKGRKKALTGRIDLTPPPKNVERVILQYVDRFLAEFFYY
jgi:hypothetical protein